MTHNWAVFNSLNDLRVAVGNCRACPLHACRTRTVVDSGNYQADLMIVGEAPGEKEDLGGMPFIGAAGLLLDKMIASIGLQRENAYVCNVIKCRPPDNRKPMPEEVAACRGHLERQIALVRPKVILALGATAAQTLLGTTIGIMKLRGRWGEFVNPPSINPMLPSKMKPETIPVMPTFHPSYLLRVPAAKREAWQDMQAVAAKLGQPTPAAPKEGTCS